MVDEPYGGTRRDMRRAIRRLSVLEYVMMALAAAAALLGGAMAAWLLEAGLGVPFRVGWTVSSVLLFALPGLAVWGREARRSGVVHQPNDTGSSESDGG